MAGEDLEACPVCGLKVSRSQIQQHCEQHFDNSSPLELVSCPECGIQLALEELDSHELAHR